MVNYIDIITEKNETIKAKLVDMITKNCLSKDKNKNNIIGEMNL